MATLSESTSALTSELLSSGLRRKPAGWSIAGNAVVYPTKKAALAAAEALDRISPKGFPREVVKYFK